MYEQINDYQFYDHGDRRVLGRKKRLQSQRRLFKVFPVEIPSNNRRANEIRKTVRGSSRALKTYIEYPLLTLKKNQRDLGKLIGNMEEIIPIGYSTQKGFL